MSISQSETVSHILISCGIKGAFHDANDSAIFGRKSNGKVCFGSLRPEYSGPPLEVILNIPTEICRFILTNSLIALLLFTYLGNLKKW